MPLCCRLKAAAWGFPGKPGVITQCLWLVVLLGGLRETSGILRGAFRIRRESRESSGNLRETAGEPQKLLEPCAGPSEILQKPPGSWRLRGNLRNPFGYLKCSAGKPAGSSLEPHEFGSKELLEWTRDSEQRPLTTHSCRALLMRFCRHVAHLPAW